MKLKVDQIGGAALNEEGELNIGILARGKTHSLILDQEAQEQMLVALLASTPDPRASVSRRLRPQGVGRFQIDDQIGLSFHLQPTVAVHLILHRKLADAVKTLIETFDDPETWNTPKAH